MQPAAWCSPASRAIASAVQPGLAGDRERSAGVVTGDHHDVDPGAPAVGDGGGNAEAERVVQAGQAQVLEGEVVLPGGEALAPAELGPRDRQHAKAARGGRVDLAGECGTFGRAEMAQVGDRFRGALGRDDVVAGVGGAPHVGKRQQLFR
jgi:hypothetical protein